MKTAIVLSLIFLILIVLASGCPYTEIKYGTPQPTQEWCTESCGDLETNPDCVKECIGEQAPIDDGTAEDFS